MRMKKIMIIAVAAIALAACSKTFDHSKAATEGNAIGFGTWTETLTKDEARVQGTSNFLAGDTFAVYGVKTDTDPEPDVTTVVFNGDVVTASGSGTLTWDYDNHRFWDSSAESYTFYAVSPSTLKSNAGFSMNAETGVLSTGSLSFSGASNDILVANKNVVSKGAGASSTYFDSYNDVNMVFNHAAALVDIYVKKASTLTSAVGISAISLNNIYKAGTLAVATADYASAPIVGVSSWTPSGDRGSYLPTNGVVSVYGDTDDDAAIAADNQKIIAADSTFNPDNTTEDTTPGASTILFNNLIVVPQTFGASGGATSQNITITYTLGTDPTSYTRTLYLADFDVVDNSDQSTDDKVTPASWEPGKHYSFYITIDAHEITFGAQITDWAAVNGYHYLIN